jgi:hypothetical protein
MEISMFTLIIFTVGYALGGITALFIVGLAVAARRGDSRSATFGAPAVPPDETVAAWQHKS